LFLDGQARQVEWNSMRVNSDSSLEWVFFRVYQCLSVFICGSKGPLR
jgi:hypothetical protein